MLHTAPHSASYIAGTKVCSQFISAAAILFCCVSIASLMPMVSLAVYAQTNTGGIRGFVYDETPAVIQEATVTALDESRGVIQEAVVTDSGGFVFSHLAPGMYTLRFEAPNFTPLTVEGFEVRVGGISTFSPQLAVAATEDPGGRVGGIHAAGHRTRTCSAVRSHRLGSYPESPRSTGATIWVWRC